MNSNIPKNVIAVLHVLQLAGYEAFVVGGSVRDLLINRSPKDWDITTNAKPDEIIPLFPKAIYENSFGTVAIIFEEEPIESPVRVIEVTTYRSDGKYTDKRHPDKITFSKSINEDLKRRDFTINAIAYDPIKDTVIDPYKGQSDLENKIIRTVNNPLDRFSEDALRMIRAIRIATELGFHVEQNTLNAIKDQSETLNHVSRERIRDELIKIIMSKDPKSGLEMLKRTNLLEYILPEMLDTFHVEQNKNHIFDVYTHLLNSLQHSADKNYPLHVRLSALFHDIGKPATREFSRENKDYTFYGHEVVGAKIVKDILKRLVFPKELSNNVFLLVRNHMFFSDPKLITLSAVRRLIARVGESLIWDLIKLRYCDRIGMGRPKESPYRLRKYEAMIEQALRDPISVKMLKINGDYLIKELHMKPGKQMGLILNALLGEVLEDPAKNNLTFLSKRALDLSQIPTKELEALAEKGKNDQESLEKKEIDELHKKHGVKYQAQ